MSEALAHMSSVRGEIPDALGVGVVGQATVRDHHIGGANAGGTLTVRSPTAGGAHGAVER
ncbi:hypothetical protein [Rhodococcus sp. 66b]|uniref:hypothetical protein n=1 Tax=Rhodococcus sp. 66b TaxID=1945511 RepID=UPI001055B444|nr:hypothetical protein [Rhodococcus sp. 66b]